MPAQAMVEFALVASLFLMLMFAILQLSLAVLTYNSVASRLGKRRGTR
jgi:Flp pilus assembly protein TadG